MAGREGRFGPGPGGRVRLWFTTWRLIIGPSLGVVPFGELGSGNPESPPEVLGSSLGSCVCLPGRRAEVPVVDRVAWQERSDAELVAGVVQVASGTDRELAFDAIYARHSEAVLARCGQFFSSDLDAAEAAAAEALTTAYRDLAAGRPPDEPHKLRAWLYGIAKHKCQEELRRRQPGVGLPDELEFDEYENASRERRAEVEPGPGNRCRDIH